MLFQKSQGSSARERCGLRVVTGAHIAVEAVSSAFIPVNFNFRMRGTDSLYLIGGNVGVEFAKM